MRWNRMRQTGWIASAAAAPNLNVHEQEWNKDPTAGYSTHPEAMSNSEQPWQVLDGVQGAKHCSLSLLECSLLLPS